MYQHLLFIVLSFVSALAFAAPQNVRWTGQEDRNADLAHILDVVRSKTGLALKTTDFLVIEDRDLAHNHFRMLAEVAGKLPMKSMALRIWTLSNGDAQQVEGYLDQPPSAEAMRMLSANTFLSSQRTMALVRNIVASHIDDKQLMGVKWTDYWHEGNVVRIVKAKAKHGTHTVTISVAEGRVLSAQYEEHPQFDAATDGQQDEFSIPVQIYPVYEEVEGQHGVQLPRVANELRYLQSRVAFSKTDPYASLQKPTLFDDKMDPVLGVTAEGQKQGFWAMSLLKTQAAQILAALPSQENSYAANGVVLEGRYATVNLHPKVTQAFKDLNFTPGLSTIFKPDWQDVPNSPSSQQLMVPSASLHGRPITSPSDAWTRLARRLPNHDPSTYINDGFDELQVYYAVNQLFDSLRPMGFTDPELSTRRFNAFLYDADISYRDNAFYTDDTINFTTYSPDTPNMARDNSTIWHELGHGVMDRLMGDEITLADTGGLSEGMADFNAQLVINDVTNGQPFPGKESLRIFNNTGFNLTNEVHDDGEAYGGTMNDMLVAAMQQYGRPGLTKVTDLTLETMRLTRNHPHLTANDWFNHMLYADEIGNHPVREPGELKPLLLKSLAGRNYNLDGSAVASYTLKQDGNVVDGDSAGSRKNPIKLTLGATETNTHKISVNLKGTPTYQFRYPVTVRVQFVGGPLQGAIHWTGKEQGHVDYTLKSEADTANFDLTALGKCDTVNRPDGSCVDYAYVQIWNAGETKKPAAKKRFYLRIYTKTKTQTLTAN